jgi:hypothetical protein
MLINPVAVEKLAHWNLQKLDRVRKLYKRFFSVSWTFSITRFLTFSEKPTFSTATPLLTTYLKVRRRTEGGALNHRKRTNFR